MTVVADLQLWADNLETIQLPEIEGDIAVLQVDVPALSALITQKSQIFTDALAAYVVTVDSAQVTADAADDRSNIALTEIYAAQLAAQTYTDNSVAAVLVTLNGLVDNLTAALGAQITSDTDAAVAAEMSGILADTLAISSAASVALTAAQAAQATITAATDLMLDVELPAINVLLDGNTSAIDAVDTLVSALVTDYPHSTLVQGIDAAQAQNESNLAPLGGTILREPINLWGKDIETVSATLAKPTLNTYGDFLVDDADFGECFEFGDATNTNVGPAYPIDFSPDRVYKITATFKVITADTWVHLGVTTQTGVDLVEAYTAKTVQATAVALGTVLTTSIYVGTDSDALDDYGILPADYIILTGSGAANKLYYFLEQNNTPGTGHVKLASLIITDVTEVLSNINAVRTELQSNIDGVSATLSADYYTAVQADSAIAAAGVALQANIDGNAAALAAELIVRADDDTAIAASVTALTATVGANTASVSSQGSAISTLEGNAAASYILAVKAGTGGAQLELVAANDPTGGVTSAARISADYIILDGSVTADKLSVTELSAIVATIGVLRTASSGERVEIKDDLIEVYDSAGTVRVKIGDLT